MKRFLFLLMTFFTCFVHSFAQTEKGSLYSGPGLNVSYLKTVSDLSGGTFTTQSAGVNAYYDLGFFVIDNLAFGPGFDVGYSWSKSSSDNYKYQTDDLTFGINPFVRYYFGKTGKLKPFLQADIGVSYGLNYVEYTTNDYEGPGTVKYKAQNLSLNAGVSAGITYFLNRVIGLECYVSYDFSHNTQSSDQSGSTEIKSNNQHANLGIGFQYYFAKSNKEK